MAIMYAGPCRSRAETTWTASAPASSALMPSRGVATVSVLHDDPLLADAAATALMVGGPARFSELLNRLDIRCALLMTEENELMVTAAMRQRLSLQRQPVPLGPPLGVAARCSERAP